MTIEQAFRAAKLRYEERSSIQEIASRLHCSSSKVFRLLRVAEQMEIVQRRVVPIPDVQQRGSPSFEDVAKLTHDLQEELRLKSVQVVAAPPSQVGKHGFSCQADEDLTQALGRAAATLLASLIRGGDRIGVGSGRSVQFSISSLTHHHLASPSCEVFSLAGGMRGLYPFRDGVISTTTADNSAVMLARVLDARFELSKHVYIGDGGSSATYKRTKDFNVGLIGVGAVARDITNCFQQFREELLEADGKNRADRIIESAEEIRTTLKQRGMKPEGALYFPLADLLGRPFVPDAPDEVIGLLHEGTLKAFTKEVNALAEKVYAASLEQLSSISHIVLVAGGARKAFPIWHVLTRLNTGTARRHTLVTDYSTAYDVLAIARASQMRHASVVPKMSA